MKPFTLKKIKLPLLSLIWIPGLSALSALPAAAVTLDEAKSAAIVNSSEVKQLKYGAESAQLNETKAFAGFLPRVEISGRHLFQEQFEELDLGFMGIPGAMPAIQPYTNYGITATYEIFSGFQGINQLSAAKAGSRVAENSVRRAEDKVSTHIRTLFYKALASQILVDVADQNIRTLEGHSHDVDARIRSGVSTRYDLLRVEVQLEDARTEKVGAESNVIVARARLFQAMGVADDGKPLVGELPTDFNRYKTETLSLKDITRVDREAATLQVEEAHLSTRAAMSHWLPRVSLFGTQEWYNNYNHAVFDEDAHFKPASSLGVQMKWTLFDGGADLATQRQAALTEKIAAEKVRQFDEALPADLEEAKKRFAYDIINYKAKLSSVRKAEEAVRLARGGVRAGTRTNTETLDAVVDLNRAKAASVKAQIDAVEALGQLELIVGHPIAE
jgi:outer membrane protein TolC